MLRFKDLYNKEIKKNLIEMFSFKNSHEVPKLLKISLNMGVGEVVKDAKIIDNAVNDLSLIAGQKAIKTIAKKSNAAFKIREGMPIGCKVTLRKDRMYEFLERMIFISLPRSREFLGFSRKNMDGRGNLSFGIKEQIVFPEIDYDKIDVIRGLDVTIVTSAFNDEHAIKLLQGFWLPFRDCKGE